MRNKYHIYLTYEERRMLLNNLNDFRNKLITKGKYTDLLCLHVSYNNPLLDLFFAIIASCSAFGLVERQFPPIFVSGYL